MPRRLRRRRGGRRAAGRRPTLPLERERKGERRIDDVRPAIASSDVVGGRRHRLVADLATDRARAAPGRAGRRGLPRRRPPRRCGCCEHINGSNTTANRREVLPLADAGAAGRRAPAGGRMRREHHGRQRLRGRMPRPARPTGAQPATPAAADARRCRPTTARRRRRRGRRRRTAPATARAVASAGASRHAASTTAADGGDDARRRELDGEAPRRRAGPTTPSRGEPPEMPEPMREGRPSVEAAEQALVRKPQIGDTRPAPRRRPRRRARRDGRRRRRRSRGRGPRQAGAGRTTGEPAERAGAEQPSASSAAAAAERAAAATPLEPTDCSSSGAAASATAGRSGAT